MSLSALLKKEITTSGPLTIDQYMSLCLSHPDYGYYFKKQPFGKNGDFTTAPEISQLFGEVIGAWCVEKWHEIGKPKEFHLIELGPGRGTLMSDLLRLSAHDKNFYQAAKISLIETSPLLKDIQKETLSEIPFTHYDHIQEVPTGPSIIIANEFFDALPIHQYQFLGNKWVERCVNLTDKKLHYSHIDTDKSYGAAPFYAVLEKSPARDLYMDLIALRLKIYGGAALAIDYGYNEKAYGDTLQAVKRHKYLSPLKFPGEADLTTHVNFRDLKARLHKQRLKDAYISTQKDFLEKCGIHERFTALAKKATPSQLQDLQSGLMRLTDSKQMGSLFKVLEAIKI